MHRKICPFPILAVHASSFPWSLLLLRWHYGWRGRGGKGPSWLTPVTFPIFHSPVWVNKDVLSMLPDANSSGSTPVQPSCAGSPLLTETVFPWYIFHSYTMYASFMKVWSTQTWYWKDTQSVGKKGMRQMLLLCGTGWGYIIEACSQGCRRTGYSPAAKKQALPVWPGLCSRESLGTRRQSRRCVDERMFSLRVL